MVLAYKFMMKQQDEKDQQIIDQVLRGGRQADYALLVDSYRARLFAFVATMVTCREDAEELEPIIKINTYFLAGIGKKWYLCGENGIKTCR